VFREATDDDLLDLGDLEREANLVGLAHVFPPARYPFPDDDVLARWRLVLDDPTTVVLVVDDPEGRGLIAFAAYDEETLRHLAVHPRHWGEGLASTAIELVLHEMSLHGVASVSLWCLEENHRARRLYEHLGWRSSADRREAPWPPHPIEMRYTRRIAASER
jgi:RimJ/RimL family protein N-acetyltransferase